MILTACVAVCALLGLLFLIAALRRLGRRRLAGGLGHGVIALVLFLAAAGAGLLGLELQTYWRLTAEQPAGEIHFARTGNEAFDAVLTYPDGERAKFALNGDEWQIDARLLKWTALANLIGFDTVYRLERIGGRYTRIEDEKSAPRTVYALDRPARVDPWALAHTYHRWIPWVDALYGSATFLPMADGASYEIRVAQSGLIARPLNQPARDAVAGWH
jgi:hypothetical protein